MTRQNKTIILVGIISITAILLAVLLILFIISEGDLASQDQRQESISEVSASGTGTGEEHVSGTASDNEEPVSAHIFVDWVYYTFEEAVVEADTIVYGKVVEKSDTLIHEASTSGESTVRNLYKEVTIEVLDVIKGNKRSDTVTYYEWGGETEDFSQVIDNFDPVKVDGEYIFYLHEPGVTIGGPSGILPVTNGVVSIKGKYAPEGADDTASGAMDIDKYISDVKAMLE